MNSSKNIRIAAVLVALIAAPWVRSEEPLTLPEITVIGSAATDTGYKADTATTATKTDTPIFDLPVSIQVVPREVLDDRQVIRVEDALEAVSGVDPGPFRGVFDAAVVRGFVVTPYRDGFRTRPIAAITSNTAHLERVEVLKGPASVLYGRTDPGGLINLVTKKPLATPYYSLQQQFGSFDLYRTTLDATGPMTDDDTLLYRVNLAYENIGSFRDFLDQEGVFVAPVLTWNLSDRTRVTFDLQYFHGDFPRDRGIVALGDRPAPIPIERSLGEPFNKEEFDDLQAGFLWQHDFNQDWTLRHRFTTEQLNLVTEEVSARSTFLPDNRSIERSYFAQDEDSEFYYTALELTGRFHTWGLRHTTLLGADYYYNEFDVPLVVTSFAPIDIFSPLYGAPRPVGLPSTTVKTSDEWYGVYFQDQIGLLEDLHLLGGGRYDGATSAFQLDTDPADKTEDENFSPRVGLVYQPLPWLSLYGSYVESFGVANAGLSRTGEAFDPETATQYEAGLKTELLDGRLSATLAFYHLTKQNILTADPVDPNFSVQTGEARSQGIEFDLSGEITASWSVIASYAFSDAEITESSFGDEGNRLPGVPEHGGSVWTRYDFQQGPWRGLSLGAGVFAVGEREGDDANTFQLPGYARVDLLAAYEWKLGNSRLTAQLNVENLLDKAYFQSSRTRSDVLPGAPRTFLGSIRLEF